VTTIFAATGIMGPVIGALAHGAGAFLIVFYSAKLIERQRRKLGKTGGGGLWAGRIRAKGQNGRVRPGSLGREEPRLMGLVVGVAGFWGVPMLSPVESGLPIYRWKWSP
jgi:hypothetical protein